MTLTDAVITYVVLSCLLCAAILVRGIWLWLLTRSEQARTELRNDARMDRQW